MLFRSEEPDLLPPSTEAGILGDSGLTFSELSRMFAAGARIVSRSAGETRRPDEGQTEVPLFAVTTEKRLRSAADGRGPSLQSGDTVILLAHTKA